MNKYKLASIAAQARRRKWQACDRKRKYKTAVEARHSTNQEVYKCRYCSFFHRSGQIETIIGVSRKKRRQKH